MSQAQQLIQLNLTGVYYQMQIKKSNKWKTAFQIRYNYFKYQMILFGLSNLPASFQSYINRILAEKFDIFVIIYLDDIFIYTQDPDQGHIEAMQLVLDVLKKHALYTNLKKC